MRAFLGWSFFGTRCFVLTPLLGLTACSSGSNGVDDSHGNVTAVEQAVNPGDDITDAFNTFKAQVGASDVNKPFRIGYGPSPSMITETLTGATGFPAKGQATLDFTTNTIKATLDDVPATGNFDLYFVKNTEGSGRTALPDSQDIIQRVGPFTASLDPNDPPNHRVLNVTVPTSVMHFDIDMVVVTRAGSTPVNSRIAVGARTLMEKRLYRGRFGQLTPSASADCVGDNSVRCQLSNEVESLDPLVRRGAQLFFKETFAGNGRTCGTCHRAENNLTIDPQFIATLPAMDPLFVAEFNPTLASLENPAMMRQKGLIQENTNGFGNQPVLRSVNHTFAMQTSIMANSGNTFPSVPPDQATGWGGDGAPGRGTLAEFALGAIVQHATKDTRRRRGTDFRIPTQTELDAMEAFQLFTGRQKFVDATRLTLRDSLAQRGATLMLGFFTGGQCAQCHVDMGSLNPTGPTPPSLENFNFDTNVRALTPTLPVDDGFLNPRNEPKAFVPANTFNVPPLIEAADTGPFFHNNARGSSIEDAVSFYRSQEFNDSLIGSIMKIQITPTDVNDIGAFLRVLNAAENVRQIRKRVIHVRDVRSSGNTAILTVAIRDCQDALNDLQQRKTGDPGTITTLNPTAVQALQTIKLSLQNAQAASDANRASFMSNVIPWLDIAKQDLFSANPNHDF